MSDVNRLTRTNQSLWFRPLGRGDRGKWPCGRKSVEVVINKSGLDVVSFLSSNSNYVMRAIVLDFFF